MKVCDSSCSTFIASRFVQTVAEHFTELWDKKHTTRLTHWISVGVVWLRCTPYIECPSIVITLIAVLALPGDSSESEDVVDAAKQPEYACYNDSHHDDDDDDITVARDDRCPGDGTSLDDVQAEIDSFCHCRFLEYIFLFYSQLFKVCRAWEKRNTVCDLLLIIKLINGLS